MRNQMVILAFGVAVGGLAVRSDFAQNYSIDWYTIDCGGIINSSDGVPDGVELSGTIGQFAAGGPMVHGVFEVTSGFWFAVAWADCNCDGKVDLVDYADFRECLTGPDQESTDQSCRCFSDTGLIDLATIARFQVAFGS